MEHVAETTDVAADARASPPPPEASGSSPAPPDSAADASSPAIAAARAAGPAAAAAPGDAKRTGRPAHPLWAHFHRGEKRNRYHHHAFCVYCVARYGAAHVAPTRGVSGDMLRHVEKCPNCPSRVLESVRAICGRRDAVRFDRLVRKKATTTTVPAVTTMATDTQTQNPSPHLSAEHAQVMSDTEGDQHHHQQDNIEQQQEPSEHLRGTNGDMESARHADAAASAASTPDAGSNRGAGAALNTIESGVRTLAGKHMLRTTFGVRGDVATGRVVDHVREGRDGADRDPLPTTKRLRSHAPSVGVGANAGQEDESAAMDWKVQLLKAAVTSGLPFQAFQNATFEKLLRHLSPSELASSPAPMLAVLSDPQFLAEALSRLESVQLDRVKEGMHNSTIKGGLTLSLNCWSTLDLQQIVAFSLVNSNGDAACVHVLDMGTQASAYSSTHLAVKIEEVLERLEAHDISVMGIVADSTVALNAARCVCLAEKRRTLMVVPCFARQLSVLAGSLLTHELFSEAVGQMVEIASYFSNASLLSVLKAVSGDGDDARIPMPNRVNWYSFVDCIDAMLKYCDVVTAICSADVDDPNGLVDGVAVPNRLKDLVFTDEGKLWKTLQELHTLLLPLKESYMVVFEHKLRGSDSAASPEAKAQTESRDSFAAAHGLTLAYIMYQLARMNQQYAGLVGTSHEALAQMMQARIRIVWQRYDFPVMLLAYVFNFHLDTELLNVQHEALQWAAIAEYFQAYFSTWFQPHAPASSAEEHAAVVRNEQSSDASTTSTVVVGPISADKVRDIFSAYKTKQFPFDADTTSDYVDVSSFYSFVSDSHPEICALCCRMYAISLLAANVQRIVRGVGFVATSTQSTKDPKTVEILLHVGFASSMKKVQRTLSSESGAATDPTSDTSQGGPIAQLSAVLTGYHPDEMFWNADMWDDFADDWRQFVELELLLDEFDAITEHTLAHARETESSSSLRIVELMSSKVPLDEVFAGTLAPLVDISAKPTVPSTSVFAEESEL